MPSRSLPPLGDLEIDVLEHLWRVGSQDVTQVHEAIGRGRRITRNTIQSTLRRLFDKGLLTREKVGHAYRYASAVDRGEFRRRSVEHALTRLADPASNDLVSTFLDLTEDASVEQLERLERELDRRLAERRKESQ